MPQQPMEESPFLAPAPEQPSTPTSPIHPKAEATESTSDPPASFVSRKVFLRTLNWLMWFTPRRWTVPMRVSVAFSALTIFGVAVVCSLDGNNAVDLFSPDGDGVAIIGKVTRFDWLDTRQVSVTWFVVGVGEYRPQATTKSSHWWCPPINTAVDVYLDDPSNLTFSYDPTKLPMTATGEGFCPPGLVSFDAEHKILTGNLYHTPFDRYTFTALAFVVERATNKSIPITLFTVGDSGLADFTTKSLEVQTTSNFTYDTNNGSIATEVESHAMFAAVTSSIRARMLTNYMFMANWLLTICSLSITRQVYKRRGEMKDGVALFPLTVILTIPVIRGFYVGSPPFGIVLDMWGFFPQMMIVVGCSITVLSAFATHSAQDRGIAVEGREV